jgi:hypothetical protein
VNCHADFQFRVRVQVLDAEGHFVTPDYGTFTDLTLRLSDTPTGDALDAEVDGMVPTEETGEPGTFVMLVTKDQLEEFVLPLGRKRSFWAIWSKLDSADNLAREFLVEDRTVL